MTENFVEIIKTIKMQDWEIYIFFYEVELSLLNLMNREEHVLYFIFIKFNETTLIYDPKNNFQSMIKKMINPNALANYFQILFSF